MVFESLEHESPAVDLDALYELAFRSANAARANHPREPAVAVEIGTWAGRTALLLSEAFDLVFTVDHLLGNANDRLGPLARKYGQEHIFRTFAKNMGDRFCRRVFPCHGLSRTWAAAWSRPIDFLFIDGSHDRSSCAGDILDWGRHLRPGAIVCCHDYGEFDGVTGAVDELLPGRKLAGATLAYKEFP